jgi:hypothetical protein
MLNLIDYIEKNTSNPIWKKNYAENIEINNT